MITLDEAFYCRVCGLKQTEPPWGEDGKTPSYEICSCCGVEFGNEDYSPESLKKYRDNWISGGAKWFSSKEKPANWDMKNQLAQIPEKFK